MVGLQVKFYLKVIIWKTLMMRWSSEAQVKLTTNEMNICQSNL